MKIDYEELREESNAKGVSIYTLIKRKLRYRQAQLSVDSGKFCGSCKFCERIKYKEYINLQCRVIGIIKDHNADVEYDFICSKYRMDLSKKR